MQNRILRAAATIAAIGFVTACEAPTPTVLNDVAPDVAAPSSDTPKQASVAKRQTRKIVVEAGQSLSRIAVKYHVPQRTIIAANDLTPPYKIKIGQHLRVPGAGGPPAAPAVVGSSPPEIIPLDRPAPPAPPATAATASPPPPVVPVLKPIEVAAPAGDKSPETPVVPVAATTGSPPASAGSAEQPAPATTAAAPPPASISAAAPPGVTCPAGTIGTWSDRDIIKLPVYICHKPPSQS
jgi:LysM repeat protein